MSRVGISNGVRRYPNGDNIHRYQCNNPIIRQVLFSIIMIWFSGKPISADQDLVFITSCRSGSSSLKSAVYQDPVLYNIMLFLSFLYNIC